jgi:RTX calcium-binding nonapeptide repeat (4 copies)
VRVAFAVLVGLAFLATPAGAVVPSSYPGAELVPIRAIAYQPAPSDYQPCQSCVYYDTDFFNDDFSQLWDDANGGRGDLRIMAEQLNVNFLHLYNWNPARNHLAALNEALSLGIRVAVPISNYFVDPSADPNPAADIEKIMRQVYVDQQGNPSSTPHPAVGMMLVANEPENGLNMASPSNPDRWQGPVVQAITSMQQAEQTIGATGLLPVAVPFTFSVDNYDANANNPNGYAAVGQNNSLIAALNAAPGLGSAFVTARFIATANTQNPGSFMTDWIPDFKQAVPDTPVWFPEQGTGVAQSCAGYQNCTPSAQQQAIFNADQFAATKPNAGDVVLGGAQFEWVNEDWKPGPNEPTFGIYDYGSFRSVAGPGGTYRVDELIPKPSWTSLHDAFTNATSGDDVLTGSAGDDVICGLGGADEIMGGAGDDTLFGDGCGAGSTPARSARAAAGAGGDDTLYGGRGNDRLYGSEGADLLSGGPGADRLRGGLGNDRLKGGPGVDRLDGGAGRDMLSARGGGRDLVNCGKGNDTAKVDTRDRVRGCERILR